MFIYFSISSISLLVLILMLQYRLWEIKKGRFNKDLINISKPIIDGHKIFSFFSRVIIKIKNQHLIPIFHHTVKKTSTSSDYVVKKIRPIFIRFHYIILGRRTINKTETNSSFLKNVSAHKEKIQHHRNIEK